MSLSYATPSIGLRRSLDEIASPPVRKLLEEIFFTYIFNSALTIHEGHFTQSQAAGLTPTFLSLAVYAIASNFLAPASRLAQQSLIDLESLGDIPTLGRSWAELAGRLCLQDIDQPTLAHAQTCQILGLYWFSRGESSRNSMLSGIAYRATRNFMILEQENSTTDESEKETMRRCFWAAFTTNSVNVDHRICGSSLDVLPLKVALPSSDASFAFGIREAQVTLGDYDDGKVSTERGGEQNLWAHAVRLIQQWCVVRHSTA